MEGEDLSHDVSLRRSIWFFGWASHDLHRGWDDCGVPRTAASEFAHQRPVVSTSKNRAGDTAGMPRTTAEPGTEPRRRPDLSFDLSPILHRPSATRTLMPRANGWWSLGRVNVESGMALGVDVGVESFLNR